MRGLRGRYGLEAESESVHHAWSVVLDHDVALLDQPEHQVERFRAPEIEAERSLARVLLGVVGRHAVASWRGEPGDVARRRLDLDHLGAEVGEHPSAVRAGQHPGEVEDPDSVERSLHVPIVADLGCPWRTQDLRPYLC